MLIDPVSPLALRNILAILTYLEVLGIQRIVSISISFARMI